MTAENDIVLIYFEDKPLTFARVEDISPDVKAGWYQIRLLMLQVPLQVVTWILREAYINGETFTMGGKRMRMERVVAPQDPDIPQPSAESPAETSPRSGAKVISLQELQDLRKNDGRSET